MFFFFYIEELLKGFKQKNFDFAIPEKIDRVAFESMMYNVVVVVL
jgi:hypothetical protein